MTTANVLAFVLGVLGLVEVSGSNCGETLNAINIPQLLQSPGYPRGYSNNLRCQWIIRAEPGSRVSLNMLRVDTQKTSRYCNAGDRLEVFDLGNINRSRTIGRYCGRLSSQSILSRSNVVLILFVTDSSIRRRGFQISYESVCGGYLSGFSGVIHSPNFPNNYTYYRDCIWRIHVGQHNKRIQLTFESFSIQGTPSNCSGDYLEVLNGYYATSPPMGCNGQARCKLCGNTAPTLPVSGSNRLWIRFVSDSSGQSTGFNITYRAVAFTCGGQLSLTTEESDGILMSPNYPLSYPNYVECTWIITAPDGEAVELQFVDFYTESGYDYVLVRDGASRGSPLLGKFMGRQKPPFPVSSTANKMHVRFRTDGSGRYRGFKAKYSIATCGGRMTFDSGVLQSPNFPSNYDINVTCTWYIIGRAGHYLNFTFESFELQASHRCTSDFLEMRHKNESGDLLGKFCGSSVPDTVRFPDNYAYIRFVSDASQTSGGFRVRYNSSAEGCGGTFTAPTGTLTSPNYPNDYPRSRICTYIITVQPGRRIKLEINDMDIRCYLDSLQIYNGILRDSPRIAYFCRGNRTVVSFQNTMKVVLRTGGSDRRRWTTRGFSANYSSDESEVCGGYVTAGPSPGYIESPGYGSGTYNRGGVQCIWNIVAPNRTGVSIHLKVVSFDLFQTTRCAYNYLQITDGLDNGSGQLIGRYCGNSKGPRGKGPDYPPSILSPQKTLRLLFHATNGWSSRTGGFKFAYSLSECGGVLSNTSGLIASPNFPLGYPPNLRCAWLISAPNGYNIQLKTLEFHVKDIRGCGDGTDYLTVRNGGYILSPSIGQFCGSDTSDGPNFRSASNQLRIEFYTNGYFSSGGFKLRYDVENTECGGLLVGSDGSLATPNFPNHYPHNIECIWDIVVADGYHVNLNFHHLFAVGGRLVRCTYDYVEVSNYVSGVYNPILHVCGYIQPSSQQSFGNRLRVKFRSDASTNAQGFSANWTAVCGNKTTARSGVLSSPFISNYAIHTCEFLMTGDQAEYVVLEFKTFQTQAFQGYCGYRAITLYEGTRKNQSRIGRFCYKRPPAVAARSAMLLVFTSYSSINRDRIYTATFRRTRCGGELTAASGTIRSPTYPAAYHQGYNCTWVITVERDKVVDLKFDIFQFVTCTADYVEAYDGLDDSAPPLGRFCGAIAPQLRSSGNQMAVKFVTKGTAGRGFSANYWTTLGVKQGCGGFLNATSGTLSSPAFNGHYSHGLSCTWMITVPDSKVARIKFTAFDIEYGPRCPYDYLEIRSSNKLIGRYCGNKAPTAITTSSSLVSVTFVTDRHVAHKGFNLSFTAVDECNWSSWFACSNPCGNGYQAQFRTCAHKSQRKFRNCTGGTCSQPASGRWGEWVGWLPCSKSCGGGMSYRSRICTSPLDSGSVCPGNSIETKVCSTIICPVNGSGNWTDRTRTIKPSVNQNTGTKKDGSDVGIIVGPTVAGIVVLVAIIVIGIIYCKRMSSKAHERSLRSQVGSSNTDINTPQMYLEQFDLDYACAHHDYLPFGEEVKKPVDIYNSYRSLVSRTSDRKEQDTQGKQHTDENPSCSQAASNPMYMYDAKAPWQKKSHQPQDQTIAHGNQQEGAEAYSTECLNESFPVSQPQPQEQVVSCPQDSPPTLEPEYLDVESLKKTWETFTEC